MLAPENRRLHACYVRAHLRQPGGGVGVCPGCARWHAGVFVLSLQLLKTLFGTNLASQFDGVSSNPSKSHGRAQRLGSSSVRPGLYHYCFMAPYTHFTQALADASLRTLVQAEQDQDASG